MLSMAEEKFVDLEEERKSYLLGTHLATFNTFVTVLQEASFFFGTLTLLLLPPKAMELYRL